MRSLLYSAVLMAVGAIALAQAGAEPTDADWKWLNQYHDRVFDAVMPMASSDVLVGYRSSRGPDVLEQYFAVRFNPVGDFNKNKLDEPLRSDRAPDLAATARRSYERSRRSDQSVQSQLSFRRLTLDSGTCGPLRVQMDKLSTISIAIPERDLIPWHPGTASIRHQLGRSH